MPTPSILSFAAAYFSLMVAASVLLRDKHSVVHRVFAGGMFLFAVQEMVRGIAYRAVLPEDVVYWHRWLLAVSSLIPAVWLGFSIAYARVGGGDALLKWKWALLAAGAAPVAVVIVFRQTLFAGQTVLLDAARWSIPLAWPGKALQLFFLFVSILIVFNLEHTIRSSTGRMRWQIKFMALGVGGLFALRIYLASQSLLFSRLDTGLGAINAMAVLVASVLFVLSLGRDRLLNANVYLSTATIQNSFTVILAGIYLIAVGLLARFARYAVPGQSLPFDAFIVFLSLTVLAVLLLSNRFRRKLLLAVSRHFRRPLYDYRSVWMDLTHRTTSLLDIHELSNAISRTVSESLGTLSVSVWLVEETRQQLALAGSTSFPASQSKELERAGVHAPDFIRFAGQQHSVIDLQEKAFEWPSEIMRAGAEFFRGSSLRYAIGLHAGGKLVGIMTLNDDRIGGEDLSTEDFVLLETLAAQLAASLLNLKLSSRLRQAEQVEAFQTVSTFFVHDLKNLASKLSLTMENLPEHFDDPLFREDALRVISGSLTKIDGMCSRLGMVRQNVELNLAKCDLTHLMKATLDEFKSNLKAEIERNLQAVPNALMDHEQIHNVLTNLVLNANEAVNGRGVIQVATIHEGDTVGFSVKDNGCGMTQEFVENSLFKPFQTTKKKGLGIGLFHSKLIVEAHRGKIEVNSTPDKGTEFRVVLPVA